MSISQKKPEIVKISEEIPTVDLGENLWANVVSFLTAFVDMQDMAPLPPAQSSRKRNASGDISSLSPSKDREEQALRCTCKNLNQFLTSEEYYQIKVMETFANRMDSLGHALINVNRWPSAASVGGYRILHDNILSVYVPLEGLYTICNSWPWGLLVRCQFDDGKFCGDLIRAVPDGTDGSEIDAFSGGYKRVLDRIFEISFEKDGLAKCEIMVGNVSQEGRQSTKALAFEFGVSFQPAKLLSIFLTKEFPCKKDGFLFKIYWDAISKIVNNNLLLATQQFEWPPMGERPRFWDEQGGPPKANELIQGIQDTRLRADRNQLLLEPLRTTLLISLDQSHNLDLAAQVSTSVAPLLKPGFYVGGYEAIYGFLRHEILHLSHVCVDTKSHRSLEEAFGSRIPENNLFGNDCTRGVLMVGRKVTGDMHVPVGEITWFADITRRSDTNTAPTTVEDQNGNRHRIVRSWNGMGTLAYPMFRNPSWDKGWLLELEGNLFAFCWSQFHQQGITILYQFPLH